MKEWIVIRLEDESSIVLKSEGVEAHLGRRSEGLDFLPAEVGDPVRLAIPRQSPQNSVILIKSRRNGKSGEIYRLFQLQVWNLVELTTDIPGGWHLDPTNGRLIYNIDPSTQVLPGYWGYCYVVENGWAYGQYEAELDQEARSEPSTAATLNRLIWERQRADRAEAALRQSAERLRGLNLLDDGYDGKAMRGLQKGHLRSIVEEQKTVGHCGSGVAKDLREIYDLYRQALPDLPQLSDTALTG